MVVNIEKEVEKPFALTDLCNLYRTRAAAKGIDLKKHEPNLTRFKDHLLSFLPDWSNHKKGRDVYLVHCSFVTKAVSALIDRERDGDHHSLVRRLFLKLRDNILSTTVPSFDGYFKPNDLYDCIPSDLLLGINTLLQGRDGNRFTKIPQNTREVIACHVSQLLMYNTIKRVRTPKPSAGLSLPTQSQHSSDRVTPFPLYIGLKQGRFKHMVDDLHYNGLSAPYTTLFNIKQDIARTL